MKYKIKTTSEQWKQDMEELGNIETALQARIEDVDDNILNAIFRRWKEQRIKCNEGYLEYMGLLGELIDKKKS